MTISTTENRYQYNGDGTTVAFSFPRYFESSSHLAVYVDDDLMVLGTNYTVTGAGSGSGGTVTMVTAPASGVKVTIIRQEPFTQTVTSATLEQYKPETFEAALDRRARAEQRLSDEVSRVLRFAPYGTQSGIYMPDPEAGKAIRWNSGATALENYELGSVDLAVPADGSVTEAKIEDDAVTEDKILDGAVTTGKLSIPLQLFTPTVAFATPGTSSFSYATQTGQYYRFGPFIFVDVALTFTPTIGTGSGALRISLPAAVGSQGGLIVRDASSVFTWASSRTMLVARAENGTSYATLRALGSGINSASIDASDMTGGSAHTLVFGGWYVAA